MNISSITLLPETYLSLPSSFRKYINIVSEVSDKFRQEVISELTSTIFTDLTSNDEHQLRILVDKLTNENEILESKNRQLKEKIKTNEIEYTNQYKEIIRQEQVIDRKINTLDHCYVMISDLSNNLNSIHEKEDNHSEIIFQLENKLKLKVFDNYNLKSCLESNNLYIEELLKKIDELETSNENILIREFKTENQYDEVKSSLNERNNKIDDLKSALDESNLKYKDMLINYSRIIDDNKYINSLMKTYQQDLTTSETEIKLYKEKCDVLEAKIVNLQDELDESKKDEEKRREEERLQREQQKGWFF